MTHSGRLCWQSIVLLALFGVGVAAVTPAQGQNYATIKPTVADAQANQLAGRVSTILRDAAAPNAAAQKELDDFFMGNLYPNMTNTDPVELGKLSTKRKQLFVRYIDPVKSQGARDHLNANGLKAMGAIAKGPYHPAVRFNAALILGQLDQAPGTPLPAGTEALVTLLENDQFKNVPVPTAVKVAALVGLQRHTLTPVDPALAARITKTLMAVATREEAPEDASPKVYGWVRRQAAKVLANQSATAITQPVNDAFVIMISDKTIDLDDRCGIAELLKPDMYKDAPGLNLDAMTAALGDLAKKVLEFESKEAKKYLDEILKTGSFAAGAGGFGGGGYEGGRGGGYGGGVGRPMGGEGGRGGYGGGGMALTMPLEELGPKYEKRRMMDRAFAIAAAADAVAAGGSDELKARLTEFATIIRTVAEGAAENDATNESITAAVETLADDVNDMVASWAPAGAPADEAEAADFEMPADAPAEAGEEAAEPAADEVPAADAKPAGPAAAEAPAAEPPVAEPAAPAPADAPAAEAAG